MAEKVAECQNRFWEVPTALDHGGIQEVKLPQRNLRLYIAELISTFVEFFFSFFLARVVVNQIEPKAMSELILMEPACEFYTH